MRRQAGWLTLTIHVVSSLVGHDTEVYGSVKRPQGSPGLHKHGNGPCCGSGTTHTDHYQHLTSSVFKGLEMGSVGNSELPGDGASIATFGGRGQRRRIRRRSRPRTVNGDHPQFGDEQGHCGTKGHHHQNKRQDLPEITCAASTVHGCPPVR